MIINTLEDAIKTIENDSYLDEVMTAYTPSEREVEFNVRPLFVNRLWVKLDPSRRAMTVGWLIEDGYHEIDHEFAADELISGELFFECVNAIWRNK